MDSRDYQPRAASTERTLLEGALRLTAVLRRRWRSIVLSTGIAAAAATGLAVLTKTLPVGMSPMPDQYTSSATVLVRQGAAVALEGTALASLAGEPRPPDSATGFEYAALLLRMLASRVILDRVITDFDLTRHYGLADGQRTRARESLLKNTRFQYARDSGTLTISFQDPDPVLARDVASRFLTLLSDWTSQTQGDVKANEKQLLEQKIVEVQGEIATLSVQLTSLQKKYGFITPQDLGAAQAATLADLRSQLILKEIDIKNYTTFARVEDPRLQSLQSERQNILDMIAQVERGAPGNGTAAQSELPDVAQRYANLALQLEVQKGIYNTLSRQYEIAKLTSDPEPVFQTLETPEVPDVKSGPQRSRYILLATLIALVVSCTAAFVRHAALRLPLAESEARAIVETPH